MSVFRRRLFNQDNSPITVEKCVDKTLFSKTINDYSQTFITQNRKMPIKFARIIDFIDYFFNWHYNGAMFKYDGSTGYLSDDNINELLDIIANNTFYQESAFFFSLKNLSAPDKDLIINFQSKHEKDESASPWYYNLMRDNFAGTTLNSITINLDNCGFSVLQNMFRNCNATTITFNLSNNAHIRPTDMSGFNEFNKKCTSMPNNIDYSLCNNIGYAWEWCSSLTEIPSYYTVTDEETRLTTPENIIGGSCPYGIGFAQQTFNICRSLKKVGPVLDLRSAVPSDDIYHQTLGFNDSSGISDIRLKNISNGDWSFIYYNYRGLPNLDESSVKFMIENAARQADTSFKAQMVKEITEPTYGWDSLVVSTTSSLMFNRTSNNGKFLKITGDYKVQLPEGITMKLVWWIGNGENQYNCAHNDFTEIIGDGELHTYTNELGGSYGYCVIELFKTDGSDLTKDVLHEILMGNPDQFKFYIGDSTTNYFQDVYHNLYLHFSRKIISSLTKDTIQIANNKGWRIKFGNVINGSINATELTPDFFDITFPDTGISSTELTEQDCRPGASNTWYNGGTCKHVAVEIPEGAKAIKVTSEQVTGNCTSQVTFVSQYNPPYNNGDTLNWTAERIIESGHPTYVTLIPTSSTHVILTTEQSTYGTVSYTVYFGQ